jgi:hypothetical protein
MPIVFAHRWWARAIVARKAVCLIGCETMIKLCRFPRCYGVAGGAIIARLEMRD